MTFPPHLIRTLVCACFATVVSRAQQLDDQPVEKDAAVQQKQSSRLPTLWIIGDSTVRVGTPGQRGWGDEMAPFFDRAKINVVNRAIGGRSSRTFLTDGRWDDILKEMQAGDIVIMQFGHNDTSPINEKPPVNRSTRCRGTIRNNSDDTVDIVNTLTGKPETVHSYGWYLRHFITTAKQKGAKAIVCSPIPRKSWSKEGTINRNSGSWGLWARQAAEQAGAQFVDLNEIIARGYETLGKEAVDPLFGDRGTHTSPQGAKFNARAVVSGLNGLAPNPVAFALSQAGQDVPAFPDPIVADDRPVVNDSGVAPAMPAQDTIPTLWIAGDSTVKINGGANPMRGWGQEIGAFFDPAKINVVNRAIGGRSSRTFYTEGRWQSILDGIKRGDWVVIQFGHNDVGRPDASSKFRGSLKGIGDETQDITKPDGKVETVHTYGWYLETFARTAREKGANVVLCSPIPHKGFDATGRFKPDWDGWRQWIEACAKETDAYYVDLCSSIARRYARLPQAEIESFYADRGTHTSPAGAKFNAQTLVAALQALPGNPLGPCIVEEPGQRTSWRFAFGDATPGPGFLRVAGDLEYSPERGYGWLKERPHLFAVRLPEGNYTVTLQFRDPATAAAATVKAEKGRVMLMKRAPTDRSTPQFTVNVHQPGIAGGDHVRLTQRESSPISASWDDRLSLVCLPNYGGVTSVEIQPAQDVVTVFVAGDSTVTDQGEGAYAGWGQMLPCFFQPEVAVASYAESGRTLYSFRWENRLDKILSLMQPQDYLLVQFGHNDQKNKAKGAGPFTTYKKDLEDYVAKVRKKNAHVVLISPMERRRWQDGKPEETLASYAEAVRMVGKEQKVPVVDLQAMSLRFYAALGEDGSKHAFVFYPAGTFPRQDKDLKDNTHHSSYGAYELARCVVQGIRENVPELAKHIRSDVSTFDPAKPDAYRSFALPLSLATENERPEGDDDNVPSSTPTVATGGGVVVTADADTCLTNDGKSGSKSANGREKSMELRRYDGVRQRLLYFRFNLSGVEGDLGGASIVLSLSSANRPRKARVFGLVDGTTAGQGENWDEKTVAYGDAAGLDGRVEVGKLGTTSALVGPLTTFSLSKDKVGDVTAGPTRQLDAFLKADTNKLVTFAVMLEFSHGVHDFYFRTKEAGKEFAPRLILPKAKAAKHE